ncbi:hypothetical protein NLI96_g9402 [Meripilus lineatus]|uniref:Uncharacterized protein n=1 Tax=Meripilus lineatus TaxID=2056292 RepID=A0AAD5UVS3_9APHY|nr:hypothetical protein NLI96_g9402 [Physisporinus lineatus]
MFSIADIQSQQENDFDEAENEEGAEEQASPSYPIRCSFSITKSNAPGALTIDAMCQDGAFIIDNISFYSDAKVGTELTAESDWKRRGLYIGPQFDTLDMGVQDEFEKFLAERGINETLALFVPEYAEYKEQKVSIPALLVHSPIDDYRLTHTGPLSTPLVSYCPTP